MANNPTINVSIATCGHKIENGGNFYSLKPTEYGVYCDACILKFLEDDNIRLRAALNTLKEMVYQGRYYRIGNFVDETLANCIKRVIEIQEIDTHEKTGKI